jgi:hypothetical protein
MCARCCAMPCTQACIQCQIKVPPSLAPSCVVMACLLPPCPNQALACCTAAPVAASSCAQGLLPVSKLVNRPTQPCSSACCCGGCSGQELAGPSVRSIGVFVHYRGGPSPGLPRCVALCVCHHRVGGTLLECTVAAGASPAHAERERVCFGGHGAWIAWRCALALP